MQSGNHRYFRNHFGSPSFHPHSKSKGTSAGLFVRTHSPIGLSPVLGLYLDEVAAAQNSAIA